MNLILVSKLEKILLLKINYSKKFSGFIIYKILKLFE